MDMKSKNLLVLSLLSSITLGACNYEALGILRAPGEKADYFKDIYIQDKVALYNEYIDTVREFSNTIVDKYNRYYLDDCKVDNYAISPISIYSALAMASSITKDKTQEELLNVLHVSKEDLSSYYKYLFANLDGEYKAYGDEEYSSKSHLSNSIWVDKNLTTKSNALDVLADDMYCCSIKENFSGNINQANKNINDFIYKETNGFLDPKIELNPLTVFVLLNTYYLKSCWYGTYRGLDMSKQEYVFTNRDDTKVNTKFVEKQADAVRLNKQEKYSSIYINGYGDVRMYFIVPTSNNSIEDVFNKTTLDQVLEADYSHIDRDDTKEYYTTTYFPEFESNTDKDIKDLLIDMGVKELFRSPSKDFTPLTDEKDINVTMVKHITKLKVDKMGIEGAAVTLMAGETSSIPKNREKIYEELVVNKAFGYVITQANVPVFTGVVNKINKVQ